jgi:hydroxyethylthiazole kinase-like sugar kinase family protein
MFGFIRNFFGSSEINSELNSLIGKATDGLDIQTAMAAHENWKLRLMAYLEGNSSEQFSPEVICFDNHCDLGQWIHGKGQAHLGNFSGFTALLEHHKMFHYAASNVVALSQAGKEAEAHKMLEGSFATFSKAVGEDLENMYHAVEQSRARKR